MLFNSFEFLIFLPIVFLLYWFLLNKNLNGQNILLLIASYFFYGWWSWEFLILLALSTLLDYLYGFKVNSANRKTAKLFLWLSVINNLGILAVFKYYDFFALEFQALFNSIGFNCNAHLLNFILPVGISFYTFHGMSYVFDIYRGKQTPEKNFITYAVFVSFFPLLVAGPIERANHLLPQIKIRRNFDYKQALDGCRLMLWGMFKKVVIADNLSVVVDANFDNFSHTNGISLVTAAIAFSFQIYSDFSGYSDIALGTAKLFGFELLSNFKFPYFSKSIAEFWKRWHISLSSWFRDYLYIPLGGSREGLYKTVRNTFIIFIVSGFWHGSNWTFIFWGFLHACAFVPGLFMKNKVEKVISNPVLLKVRSLLKMLMTFGFVTIAWIFFRAKDISFAWGYIKHMFSSLIRHPGQIKLLPDGFSAFYFILPLVAVDWYLRNDERSPRVPKSKLLRYIIYALLAFFILIYFDRNSSFIYFSF